MKTLIIILSILVASVGFTWLVVYWALDYTFAMWIAAIALLTSAGSFLFVWKSPVFKYAAYFVLMSLLVSSCTDAASNAPSSSNNASINEKQFTADQLGLDSNISMSIITESGMRYLVLYSRKHGDIEVTKIARDSIMIGPLQ